MSPMAGQAVSGAVKAAASTSKERDHATPVTAAASCIAMDSAEHPQRP